MIRTGGVMRKLGNEKMRKCGNEKMRKCGNGEMRKCGNGGVGLLGELGEARRDAENLWEVR